MNVKRFLSDSFRRNIDNRINVIVTNHNMRQKSFDVVKTPRKTRPRKTFLVNQLTPEDGAMIYKYKCDDLDLIPNDLAKMRFVEQFTNSIHKKSLHFSGLGLGPSSTERLIALISDKPQYCLLDLSHNRLQDDGAYFVAAYIQYDPPLIYLDLRSNSIGIKGSTDIFTGLQTNNHITCLDMSAVDGIDRNRIGSPGCKAMADMLYLNQVISHLNVSMCGITSDGCKYLGKALAQNTSLMYLDMSSNRFGSKGAIALFTPNKSFGSIETLNLSRNMIGDEAADIIAKRMKQSKTLRCLDLSFNIFTSNFLKYINDAYEGGSRVAILSLASNKIIGNWDYLTHVLTNYQYLRVLNLCGNKIGDKGIKKIAEALERNKGLVSLDLSQTECGDIGATSISELLFVQTDLNKLYLDKNNISDEGGMKIFQALEGNRSLGLISLNNNSMKDGTANAIIRTLKNNTTIGDIDVSMNDFSYRSYVKVNQLIEEHKKTLNSNITDVAERHVDWLKSEERRLFQFREDIKEQEAIVDSTSQKKALHLEELAMLKKSCNEQIKKMDDELNQARDAHEQASIERMNVQNETNTIKLQYEQREAQANADFQSKANNRQRVETRLRKLQAERAKIAGEHQQKMNELNAELKQVVDDLKYTIQFALGEKKRLEDEERMRELEAKAQAKAAKKKGKKKTTKKKKKVKTNAASQIPTLIPDIIQEASRPTSSRRETKEEQAE